jgi:hypothetical protein
VTSNVSFDVSVEVKRWGAMRDRPTSSGTLTVSEQIVSRINTLRNQVESALRNPTYTLVRVEVRGIENIPDEFRASFMNELINYRGLADQLHKRFEWRRV